MPLTRLSSEPIAMIRLKAWFYDLLVRAAAMERPTKRALMFSLDVLLCIVSVLISYWLRLGVWVLWGPGLGILMAVAVVLMVPIFLFSGMYSAIFRYAGRGTLRTLTWAASWFGGLYAAVISIYSFENVPRTVGIIQPVLFFMLVFGLRLLVRYLVSDVLTRGVFTGGIRTTVIYGSGRAGQQLARTLQAEPSIRLLGFIDDDPKRHLQKIDGVPVFSRDEIETLIADAGLSDIYLAMPSIGRSRRRQIVEDLQRYKVHVGTLPPMRDVIEGRVKFSDIRELDIEDLLGRDPVAPQIDLLQHTILGKCVMVTGAGGSIGSELARQIALNGASELVLFEISEYQLYRVERELAVLIRREGLSAVLHPVLGSVVDHHAVKDALDKHRPDTVYHAAAYKHVPLVESNPIAGVRNNILGTHVISSLARDAGVANFVLISTDKAVRPTNIMGASKRAAEMVVQLVARQARGNFSMVRFGNVLGSSGSVVPLFREQIARGGPITLTHRDITRFFMTIPEASQLVIQAAGLSKGGEVFVLDMGDPVKIYDLARAMITYSGLSVIDDLNPNGDIAILEVGLRPGEKLYEELLIGNNPVATSHPRIMMANEDMADPDYLAAWLTRLAENRDPAAVVPLLQELIPEFEHNRDVNSAKSGSR
jgi:FlaA1/EpsC-like NDP-sugar epimerase